MTRSPAVLLMGPTGAGKTDLAAALVGTFPARDRERRRRDGVSRHGHRHGQAVARAAARAPHHLIDLIDPAESYSAARFIADADAAMTESRREGRAPLLVGGTMLYFRAMQSGLARLPAADPAIRAPDRSARRGAGLAGPARGTRARSIPPAAARIRPGDRQRIQRALEVIERSGRPISALLAEDLRGARGAGDLRLVLAPADRAALYERIAQRFDEMMRRGLLEEVRGLPARGDLHAECRPCG